MRISLKPPGTPWGAVPSIRHPFSAGLYSVRQGVMPGFARVLQGPVEPTMRLRHRLLQLLRPTRRVPRDADGGRFGVGDLLVALHDDEIDRIHLAVVR